jgi:cysteine-rich repeat protein
MQKREGRQLAADVAGGALRRLAAACGAVALIWSAPTFAAAGHGATGDQLVLKDGTKKQLTVQSKDGAALPAPSTSPVTAGATLELILTDTAGAHTETFSLPASGWKESGTSFKYKGAKGTPIKAAVLKAGKLLKVAGATVTTSLAGAPSLRASATLTIDTDAYCVDFSTPANPNTTAVAKWGAQQSPALCPAPTTTTTTGPTTTTTTLPPGCGNGQLDAGEQCDDGNLVDGDGCDGNCTLTGCGNGIVTAGEQCDGGADCNGDCESTASTCGAASATRLVLVTIDTPTPLAGASVQLEYPQLLTSIPGHGDSSLVQSRIFSFPLGSYTSAVNDNDTSVTAVYANTSNFITSGPLFALNFDECVDVSQNFCNRNPGVIGCCNDPNDPSQFPNTCGGFTSPTITCDADEACPVLTSANDADCTAANTPYKCCTGAGTGTCSESSFCTGVSNPNACCTGNGTGTCTAADLGGRCTFRCPGNPPVCPAGHFPTSLPAGPCDNVPGACPGEGVCVTQVEATSCIVSSPVTFNGSDAVPVSGVTCTVTIL